MDFGRLYFSADGRISRKVWWLGSIGLTIIAIVIGLVLGFAAGLTGFVNNLFGAGLTELALIALIFIPYRSLTYKRLHDRSRPEALFWAFIGPSIVSPILMLLGLSGSWETMELFGQVAEGFKRNALGEIVSLAVIGVGLWSLVELGILKGDPGDNAHGPDPLAR